MVLGVLRGEPRAAELPMPQELRDVLRLAQERVRSVQKYVSPFAPRKHCNFRGAKGDNATVLYRRCRTIDSNCKAAAASVGLRRTTA